MQCTTQLTSTWNYRFLKSHSEAFGRPYKSNILLTHDCRIASRYRGCSCTHLVASNSNLGKETQVGGDRNAVPERLANEL